MNPIGYTRLGESERRLFGVPVKDMVDFPLVSGSYRYNESVIVVNANGTYRCLEVWGNNDYTTTVGMVAGTATPPLTWVQAPVAGKPRQPHEMFTFDLFPCAIVLYDWTSIDKSPPFVRWSGMFHGVPSGALRHDVSRIAIEPKTGSARLYAPGMANPQGSFRDPSQVSPISEPETVATPVRSGPDTAMLVVAIGGSIGGFILILVIIAAVAKRRSGKSSVGKKGG